jgi:hypothetical protein
MTTTVDTPTLRPIAENEALTYDELEALLQVPAPTAQGELFKDDEHTPGEGA